MIIEVKNVSKIYSVRNGWGKKKEVVAVDDVSFSIEEGECVGFIGPNGAGKSTTVKMLSGIIKPTSGEISVLGMDPIKDRKKLNYMTSVVIGQKSQLSAHLSARDNFSLIAGIYDIDKKDYIQRFEYLTNEFEISGFVDTPIRHLSLGQRIRCEIIAALLHKPKVIFLDEPTIGLDTIAKQSFRSYKSDIVALGDIFVGIVLFFYAYKAIKIPLFIGCLICSTLIVAAFTIFFETLSFRLKYSSYANQLFYNILQNLAIYPSNIFSSGARIIVMTVLPAFFISFVPVNLLENFNAAMFAVLIFVSALWFVGAYVFFYRSIRKYESGSSMNLLT